MTKVAFAETTTGQFSNSVSTNHCPLPLLVPKSCLSFVSFEKPMSENGSPLSETQTRYCRADESVEAQLNVIGLDTTAPPVGEVSVAALCVSQFAAALTGKWRGAEEGGGQSVLERSP